MTTHKKGKASRRKAKQSHFQLKLTPKIIKLVAVAVILLLLIAVYVLAARSAVTGYQKRMASGQFSFTGNLTFVGQDFLSPLNSNLDFNGVYNATRPARGNAHFSGNWANRDYSGDAQVDDGRLYLALSGPDMPVIRYRQGSYLLPLQSGQEYTAKIDESLYDNICAHNQPASLQHELELYRTIKSLKLTASPLVNFWANSGGYQSTHLSATLSGPQLAKLWSAVQNAAPPGCGDPNTIGFTSDDLKHVSTHVALYAGKTMDTIKVTLKDKSLGANATFTLNTFSYGTFVRKQVPDNAIDINALYARYGG